MKYAILGDIHGNLEALEAVLEDACAQGVTHYACVGDVVGYNADPHACLERVRALDAPFVRGNHDHYVAEEHAFNGFNPLAAKVLRWTREQMTPEEIAFLDELPFNRRVENFTLVHSTLDMPEKWGYVFDRYEAEAHFAYQRTPVCFFGHTHVPMLFEKTSADLRQTAFERVMITLGKRYFINVGSVGQPRDGDPRAAYAVYDMPQKAIELRRIEYDIAKAQKKILDAGLPERLARRLETGS